MLYTKLFSHEKRTGIAYIFMSVDHFSKENNTKLVLKNYNNEMKIKCTRIIAGFDGIIQLLYCSFIYEEDIKWIAV